MPFSPAAELMLTRLPPRSDQMRQCGRAGVPGADQVDVEHGAPLLGVVSSQVPTVRTPALATAASNPPNSCHAVVDGGRQRRRVADVDDLDDGVRAVLFGQASGFGQILTRGQRILQRGQRLADVDQERGRRPLRLGAPRDCGPSPGSPGHQYPLARNPSLKGVVHAFCS